MESDTNPTPESLMANNYYYQKRNNMDAEKNKMNLDKAVKRKQREALANVACEHAQQPSEKCNIANIPSSELEEFHDRYWNCPGAVNKRIFVATYLTVDPNENGGNKDICIMCYCPRPDGTMELICQKSFLSVLGVSKHKVLAIGHAKLMNGEYLYKEKRGSKRWKSNSYNNGMSYSNENSQNNSISLNDNESTTGSNFSENVGPNMNRKPANINAKEDNGESNKSLESHNKALAKSKHKNDNEVDENFEDKSTTFEARIKNKKPHPSHTNEDDEEEENEPLDIFQPVVELTESYLENEKSVTRLQSNSKMSNNKPSSSGTLREERTFEPIPPHMLRKGSLYENAEERMAAREKARAILENFHIRASKRRQVQTQRNFHPGQRNLPPIDYMGPENWQRAIERNIRRRQRMQEVKIDCNHNLTRFCKVISVPNQDLINFHNMYWNCQGLVEERIFLARYMIVTPCNHRREMTIATRIPTSDGQLVEVCQKSFLSIVGITKHKVQAAARAVLKGTLYRKDGRGGFHVPKPPRELSSHSSAISLRHKLVGGFDSKNHPRKIIKSGAIPIDSSEDEPENDCDNDNSSNKNLNFDDSQHQFDEDDSQMLSVEDAYANGKLNYDEFRKNVAINRANERYQVQIKKLKCEIKLYLRRSKKLSLERKFNVRQIASLRMENIRMKKELETFKRNAENTNLRDSSIGNALLKENKIYNGQPQSLEQNLDAIANFNHFHLGITPSKDENIFNQNDSIKYEQNMSTNFCIDNITSNFSSFHKHSNRIEDFSKEIAQIQNDIS